jgi:oligosaccharide repeat unit polymerase
MQKYMRIYLTKTKPKILFLYLVAYALLWFGYATFIVPIYGYSGFEWEPNMVKLFESLAALVFFALSLPSKIKRPSDFFIHVHFLLPVIPMLVLYSASDLPRAYMYFVILAFAVVCLVRKFKVPKIKGGMIPIQIMTWGLLIIAAIYIISIIMQGGVRYFNLNLMKVYEFRSVAAQALPGIYGYFSPMVSKVLLPFILLLAVYRRKWLIAGLALAGSVMMFALTNHKGPLFYPFLVLGIYWVMNFRRRIRLLLAGYILVILVSLAPFLINNSEETEQPLSRIIVGSLLLHRACFVPAHLNFVYYDFFSTHPHTMLAQSKLTFGLVEYPYELDSSHLIGYHYYNNELCGANTGWLGSGYMHFGFAGMLIYALIVGLLLGMVDTLAKRRELGISVAILFTPFFTLFLSSDLSTCMLTHGFLLALFLTWSCQLKGRVMSEPRKTIARFFKIAVRRLSHADS